MAQSLQTATFRSGANLGGIAGQRQVRIFFRDSQRFWTY